MTENWTKDVWHQGGRRRNLVWIVERVEKPKDKSEKSVVLPLKTPPREIPSERNQDTLRRNAA